MSRIYVLSQDVSFFGHTIKRGTVYVPYKNSKDHYACCCEENGIEIIMPSYDLHFRIVENNPLFIKTFSPSLDIQEEQKDEPSPEAKI